MSNDVEIANSTIAEWLGGAVLACLGWAFKLERGRAKLLTREEHEKICTANQTLLMGLLDKIDKKLDKQDVSSDAWRTKTDTRLDDVTTKVAVLQAFNGSHK